MRETTEFGSWLKGYGVTKAVDGLRGLGHSVSKQAVHQWLNGETAPKPQHALALHELSGGAMPIEKIYRHRDQLRHEPGPPLAHTRVPA